MQNLVIGDCNDNNTGPNSNDDFFSITFKVVHISGSINRFNATVNGKVYGPFRYNEVVSVDSIPANGTNYIVQIDDNSNSGCNVEFTVQNNPCSSCDQIVDAEMAHISRV